MVLVAPGTFAMGPANQGGDEAEGPRHTVRLTKRYWIDRTEVTTSMYYSCIEAGACTANRIHVGDAVELNGAACNTPAAQPRHPINCVDRAQAEVYCAWSRKRLPTEAEWEYAARGTDDRAYPWGNNAPTSCTMAEIAGLSGDCKERKGTSEVARTPDGRSAVGLYDMAGNVWEWVADGHTPYTAADAVDPHAPDPPDGTGVLRGGGWDYSAAAAKATFRNPSAPNAATPSTGFRCARNAD
jgi:serine/threonine-protein kinase